MIPSRFTFNLTSNMTPMSRYLSVVVLFFALCCICSSAESGAVVLDAGFDAFVQQLLDVLHVPGLSLAVIRSDTFESKVRCNVHCVS